ncbi:unnamed protein product [Debaryomyces tyrocola]|nr:unnamed protein product [Debaryomyces tyrocola]
MPCMYFSGVDSNHHR